MRPNQFCVALGALALAILACNVQFGGPVGTPVGTPGSSVVFIAPANNSTVAEGSTITLAVAITDAGKGVARVEFLLDGISIEKQNAPTAEGIKHLVARLAWKAAGIQSHFITAEASRDDGSKIGEAGILVHVVAAPQLNATQVAAASSPSPGSTAAATEPPQPPAAATATTAVFSVPPPASASPIIAVVPATTQPRVQILEATTPPTPTPANVPILTVTFDFLNVRAEPNSEAAKIGQLNRNETARVVGRNAERTWLLVEQGTMRGWVTSNPNYSQITGDTTHIPLVESPQTGQMSPTPSAQQTGLAPVSTVGNAADLVIERYVMTPQTPSANETFFLTIVVTNRGAVEAPSSLLVGIFQPGDERSEMAVPPIKPGQSVTLPPMYVTLKTGGPNQSAKLTVDSLNEVSEGSVGEANNVTTITYDVN